MEKETIVPITDDSGFLGLYNPSAYKSYVDEEWELQQLFGHFVNQMNQNNCLIWESGSEGVFNVRVSGQASGAKPFREQESYIAVTDGRLNLSNFEELSMAASYSDIQLPTGDNPEIKLDNGTYKVTIRQLFNPEADNVPGKSVDFELVLQKQSGNIKNSFKKIIWKE